MDSPSTTNSFYKIPDAAMLIFIIRLSGKKVLNAPATIFVLDTNIESYYSGTMQLTANMIIDIVENLCG